MNANYLIALAGVTLIGENMRLTIQLEHEGVNLVDCVFIMQSVNLHDINRAFRIAKNQMIPFQDSGF